MLSRTVTGWLALAPFVIAGCVADAPSGGTAATDSGPGEAGADGGGAGDGAVDSPSACGAPGAPCCVGGGCSGGAQCGGAGICACSAGQEACAANCVDIQTNAAHCGACGHDCQGGPCNAGKCQIVTLANTEANVNGMVVDATGVTWTMGTAGGGVRRCAKDGTAKVTLQTGGPAFGPSSSGTDVFWSYATKIWRCTLPSCGTGAVAIATSATYPVATAFDPGEGRVYWANEGTPASAAGSIGSIKLGASASESSVAGPLPFPTVLLISNGFLYWTNYGTFSNGSAYDNNGRVSRAPLGVGKAEETVVPFDPTHTFEPLALAVSGTTIFWGRDGATPLFAKVGAGTPIVFDDRGMGVTAIAADATNVYWAVSSLSGSDGKILTCPVSGCPLSGPTILAQNLGLPSVVALDATAIYWGTSGSGLVQKLAK